jgi:hypothetical protein
MKSWGDAYQALLFSSETDFIDCPGRNAANELFLEQLSDDAGISMRECQSEEIVALVLEHFSEETREAIVEDSFIAPRLAQGIAQRRQSSQDLDAAMADILADERQRVGRRALGRFVGAGYRHAEGSSTIIKYPSLGSSYALTGQRPMVAGALVSAFSWVFVSRSEREQVPGTIVEDLLWRWFVIPLQQDLVPLVDRQGGGLALPRGYSLPPPPAMQEEVGSDVDLVAVATSQFSALDVDEIVVTILDTFQRPERCLNLNVPLPMGSPPMETGLQRLLYWGEMPAVMLADMVVLPFTRDNKSSAVLRSLGNDPFSWKFLMENMTIGVFQVEKVSCGSYTVSFVKRIVGPASSGGSSDPISRLVGVEVNLDHRYGLLLSEFAVQTSLAWLGKEIQPRMINVVPSPVKQRTSQALAPVESRKRGRVSWDDEDGNGPPPPVLLTDMSDRNDLRGE